MGNLNHLTSLHAQLDEGVQSGSVIKVRKVMTCNLEAKARTALDPFFFFFYPFPHDKTLNQTELKAFADDKLNVTKMMTSVFDTIENIVGKGEIACTSNCSFSYDVFQRLLSQTRQKVSLRGNGLIIIIIFFFVDVSLDQTL